MSIVEQSGPMDIILREAAQNGDYMIIKDLVSTGQASIEKRDASNGYTPLHYSCANGHLECVSTLLMLGADPSASTLTSANGCVTPLMLASQAGFDEIVALLLHHNSHVSERDSNNMRAYDHAAEMAIALKGVESGRRRDCEVILRVQDDPGDGKFYGYDGSLSGNNNSVPYLYLDMTKSLVQTIYEQTQSPLY